MADPAAKVQGIEVFGVGVYGVEVDSQTRCRHYRQLIDVIALKCACCERYYPCFQCHQELTGNAVQVWPAARDVEPAVLCGVCGHQLRASDYLQAHNCPKCQALFNPACKAHKELYFEV